MGVSEVKDHVMTGIWSMSCQVFFSSHMYSGALLPQRHSSEDLTKAPWPAHWPLIQKALMLLFMLRSCCGVVFATDPSTTSVITDDSFKRQLHLPASDGFFISLIKQSCMRHLRMSVSVHLSLIEHFFSLYRRERRASSISMPISLYSASHERWPPCLPFYYQQ